MARNQVLPQNVQAPAPVPSMSPTGKNGSPQKGSSSKRAIIAVLTVAIVIVIALIVVAMVYVIHHNGADDSSEKYLELADQYAESMDYESAISNYWAAIDVDPYNETAYVELGGVYEENNLFEDARSVYQLGYDRIGSTVLYDLLQNLVARINIKDYDPQGAGAVFNQSLVVRFTSFTYGDFRRQYGEPTLSSEGGIYTATYQGLAMQFLYYNSDTDSFVISDVNKKPMNNKKPNEIIVEDLSLIFTGMGENINLAVLRDLGIEGAEITQSSIAEKMVVRFVYNAAVFEIECTPDGTFSHNAWNRIYPGEPKTQEQQEETQVELHKLTGVIRDATTSGGLSGVSLSIASQENPSEEIANVLSNGLGGYEIEELAPGDYVITADLDGYISDSFPVTIYENGNDTGFDMSLSPVLAAGEIRIVLTWNAAPRDLDSYLTGSSSDGSNVDVFFMNKVNKNRSGQTIAELDVDDMNGYGPETTTIYDADGTYTFTVRDFESTHTMGLTGATVRVYMDGQSAPIVIECPSDVRDVWNVCTISNRNVNVVNTSGDMSGQPVDFL